jgi:hypothetical protein
MSTKPKTEVTHASVRWVDMPDNLGRLAVAASEGVRSNLPTGDAYYTRIQKVKETAGIMRPTPDGLRHSFCSYHYDGTSRAHESKDFLSALSPAGFARRRRAFLLAHSRRRRAKRRSF